MFQWVVRLAIARQTVELPLGFLFSILYLFVIHIVLLFLFCFLHSTLLNESLVRLHVRYTSVLYLEEILSLEIFLLFQPFGCHDCFFCSCSKFLISSLPLFLCLVLSANGFRLLGRPELLLRATAFVKVIACCLERTDIRIAELDTRCA